jgi:hypothetical protein
LPKMALRKLDWLSYGMYTVCHKGVSDFNSKFFQKLHFIKIHFQEGISVRERVNLKTIYLATIITFLFSFPLTAFQWGVGYNNNGLTSRFWLTENLVSEISINFISYTNHSFITTGIKPLSFKIYSDKNSWILLGISVTNNIYIKNNLNSIQFPSTHDCYINLLLPEIEFKIPFVENLSIYTNVGFQCILSFDGNNSFKSVIFGFYGIGLNSLGIIYYF